MITIKKIAEIANISAGTVDRIIHNRGQVTQENVDLVNSIIEKYGYKRNVFASNLALNKKFKIAVFLPNPDELEYWQFPINGIEKAKKEYEAFGFTIDYFYYKYDSISFKKTAKNLLNLKYDGLLIAPIFYNESIEFLKQYKKRGVPIVLLDSNIQDDFNHFYIGQDAYQSGVLSAKLIAYGLNNNSTILIIKITKEIENTSIINQRVKGFYNYFNDNKAAQNHTINEINIINPEKINFSLDMFKNIDAIFIPNSRSYLVAEFLKKNSIDTIRMIGYDMLQQNTVFLKLGYIDFLINQKPDEQGYIGISKLYKKIVLKNEDIEKNKFIPIEIITKENYFEV